jgi:YHS domain-containing protein
MKIFAVFIFLLLMIPTNGRAAEIEVVPSASSIVADATKDSDGDGFSDMQELAAGYDPFNAQPIQLRKTIKVSIKDQRLRYYTGDYFVKEIKVSTGIAKYPTPRGTFTIDKKMLSHLYAGDGYYFPNTKWNMRFKFHPKGSYYIHGAYWHNAFGKQRSHGCVNVAYKDVEALYNWAPEGTQVTIE